jgi:putative ABC transport system substrate-binding protein
MMKRREFITLLGGAATAWSSAARAQQPAMPVVGYLYFGTPGSGAGNVAALRNGLSEAGYVEGRDVAIELRFARGSLDRLPRLAADLASRQVAVIVAAGSPSAVLAAKATTSTIPIVFAMADDPVKYGVVASLNRPGGNVTGVHFRIGELGGKRLNLLLDLIPQATTVAYLSGSSGSQVFEDLTSDMLEAARTLGRQIIVLEAQRDTDFEAAFATLVQRPADALIVGGYTFFLEPRNRDNILSLAARHKIPAMYPGRVYAVRGGLMSYGADIVGVYRQVGAQIAQILRGARPADLPVQQPSKYELVINLKTAELLGIRVPKMLLAFADELIK